MGADNGSGVAATVPEDTPVSSEEPVTSNGSPLPPAAAAEADLVVEPVSSFKDARWVGGTWELKQFAKDGKTDWDAVIDAGKLNELFFYIINKLPELGSVFIVCFVFINPENLSISWCI